MIALTNSEDAIFNTIQGEGRFVGYPSTFVRLSRCNLRCQWQNPDGSFTRCDTPHTSFDPVVEEREIKDIVKQVTDYGTKHVVITGGEPFFQKKVDVLIGMLYDLEHHITVETNGTLYRPNKAQFMSISPKLSTSSMSPEHGKRHERNRFKLAALAQMIENHEYQFKFVVNTKSDILEIEQMVEDIYAFTKRDISANIWLMPQGTTKEQFDEKLPWLAGICKSKGWCLTDRLHIRIYGARKGV